jgi:hypothetical protein
LVPLLDCSKEGATYAFIDKIFITFGVLVEIPIDQGTKFCGEFQ